MRTEGLFRAAAGLAGVLALVIQFVLMQTREGGAGPFWAALDFFSYFTILSNIFGAVVMCAAAFAPETPIGRFARDPATRTAATLYLIVVGAVYHAILASQWEPKGWQLFADILLHTLTPVAMVADWLLFTPKRDVALSNVARWLLFPAGYGAYALARGALTGFYPYPFLEVGTLGYPQVLLNLVVLLAIFAGLGATLVVAGRRLPQLRAA